MLSNWTTAAYDGTNFIDAASIRTTSVGTIGTGRTPTKMEFMTMTDVTTGVLTTALTLNETQKATFANTVELTSLSILDTTYKSFISVLSANNIQIGSSGLTTVLYRDINLVDSALQNRILFTAGANTFTFGGGYNNFSVGAYAAFTKTITFTAADFSSINVSASINSAGGAFAATAFNWTSGISQTAGSGPIYGLRLIPTVSNVTGILYGIYSNIATSITGGGVGYAQYHAGTGSHYFGDSNIIAGTTTGIKLLTATGQKLGVWGATPITQPTTAIAAATFVANTSGTLNDTATWDGYTAGQVVKALRNLGILA